MQNRNFFFQISFVFLGLAGYSPAYAIDQFDVRRWNDNAYHHQYALQRLPYPEHLPTLSEGCFAGQTLDGLENRQYISPAQVIAKAQAQKGADPKVNNCVGDIQYVRPTNPGQTTKQYRIGLCALYKNTVPTAKSPRKTGAETSDFIENSNVSACNITTSNGQFCVQGKKATYVMMSDYFIDACGNKYMGFWESSFVRSMKELNEGADHQYVMSRGRNFFTKPLEGASASECKTRICRNINPVDQIPMASSELKVSDFLFFSPVNAKDEAKISNAWDLEVGPQREWSPDPNRPGHFVPTKPGP